MVDWSAAQPGFNAEPLAPREEAVRDVLLLPHVASLGAHTHCGCGFRTEGPEDDGAAVRGSRQALAGYAAAALERGRAELYVCWNGDATQPVAQHLALTPEELAAGEGWLEEGTHVRLVRPTA